MSIKDQVLLINILTRATNPATNSHALSAGNPDLFTSKTIVQQEIRKFGGDFVEKVGCWFISGYMG